MTKSTARRCAGCWRTRAALHVGALIAAGLVGVAAHAAQADICENKTGPELIRCIEAAARTADPPRAPAAPASPAKPAAAGAASPPASAPVVQAPRAPAEDCTGRSGEALRHCLAAGGRLAPEAAITPAVKGAPAGAAGSGMNADAGGRSADCEGKSGEALRLCVEAQAKDAPAVRKTAHTQVVSCTGYTPADQPFCLHRNTALVECRKASLYPDKDVCLRSHMARAPEPGRADCSKLAARPRAHCEARNQVYASCLGDKLGYFACLEHRLGADAVLTRR